MLTAADLTIDEEFRELLPALSDDEAAGLRVMIAKHGFQAPLIAWLGHGIIVDGMNRLAIWDQFYRDDETRQPDVIEMPFADRAAVVAWIIKNQLGRRNLTAGQRATIVLPLKPQVAQDAKRRQEGVSPISDGGGRTDEILADIAGVGRDSIRKAEEVQQLADPQTVAAMQAGEISLNAAHKTVKPPRDRTPVDLAAESERQAKRSLSQAGKLLEQVRRIWGSLQDDDRDSLRQDVAELLGTMEGEE